MNEVKTICQFLGSDPTRYELCYDCPFGDCTGDSENCPRVHSVDEAIEMLDRIAKNAKAWADKMTNL